MAVDGIRLSTPVTTNLVAQRNVNFQGAGEEAYSAPQPQSSGGGGGSVLLGLVALGAAITAGVLLHKNSKLAKQLAEGAKKVTPEADAAAKTATETAGNGVAQVVETVEQAAKKAEHAKIKETAIKNAQKASSQEVSDAVFNKNLTELTQDKHEIYTALDRLAIIKGTRAEVKGNIATGRTFNGEKYTIELKEGKPVAIHKGIENVDANKVITTKNEALITDSKEIDKYLKDNEITLKGYNEPKPAKAPEKAAEPPKADKTPEAKKEVKPEAPAKPTKEQLEKAKAELDKAKADNKHAQEVYVEPYKSEAAKELETKQKAYDELLKAAKGPKKTQNLVEGKLPSGKEYMIELDKHGKPKTVLVGTTVQDSKTIQGRKQAKRFVNQNHINLHA